MNVIFVNYGLFNSNSGGHVAQFANALAAQGVTVTVLGDGDLSSVNDYGPPAFEALPLPKLGEPVPEQVLDIARRPDTLLHAWTPRGNVVAIVDQIVAQTGCPYVVHLEDHEYMLLASSLNADLGRLLSLSEQELDAVVPPMLAHPRKAHAFMSRAAGVTVIVERLAELCPAGVPWHVLEPGVDAETFHCDLAPDRKQELRASLYIEPEDKIIVYNGNTHAANHREMFSLYTAVMILRRRGHKIVLIRTGRDYHGQTDPSQKALQGDWVIDLGILDRARMIEILKIADFYVQPGPSEGFNAYRLPSKVPEFLAMGRPLLLPATNIGLRLRDGEEALLLRRGDGIDIADRLEELLARDDHGESMGAAGRRFVTDNMNWHTNAARLREFYQTRLQAVVRSDNAEAPRGH